MGWDGGTFEAGRAARIVRDFVELLDLSWGVWSGRIGLEIGIAQGRVM